MRDDTRPGGTDTDAAPSHLSPAHAEAWRRRELEPAHHDAVERHLAECADCRARYAFDSGLSHTVAAPTKVGGAALPAHLGRYRLVERLGAGAMGEVFAAEDPELGRTVALKVLSTAHGATHLGSQPRTQLLQEARAAARVQHPNVVSIYDVISDGDTLALAMELVRAGTLRDWLRAPRPWRETLRVLLDAGRGLEAVHAAGLLHRDFKPANVLVGEEGRARVADFGLAHVVTDATRAEGLVGTPAYMSAQTLRGEAPTTADDVYAFAATAWESLYGRRPSDADALAGLLEAASRPPPPAPPGEVPARIGEALRRGLDPRRELRISLAELLQVFERTLRPRSSRAPLAAALGISVLAALAGFVGWSMQRQLQQRCAELTTPERLGQTPALEGTALARWAERWRARRSEVCLGETAVPLDSQQREAAGFCLDQLRPQFTHLAQAVLAPGRTLEQRTALLALTENLPSPDGCLTLAAGAQPSDTAVVLEVNSLRESGEPARAIEVAAAAFAADAGGDVRVAAGLHLARGRALMNQGEVDLALADFVEAAVDAEQLHDDTLRAAALVAQARVLGFSRQDHDAASLLMRSIRPLLERAATPATRIDGWLLDAALAADDGRLEEADALLNRAEQLAASTGDAARELEALTRHLDIGLDTNPAAASELLDRSWARALVLAPQSSTSFAALLESRGHAAMTLGRTDELRDTVERQREVLAGDASSRGALLRFLADWQLVEALGDEAAARRVLAQFPDTWARFKAARDELAVIEFQARWLVEGLTPARRALETARRSLGDDAAPLIDPWLAFAAFLAREPLAPVPSLAELPEEQRALHLAMRAWGAAQRHQPDAARAELAAMPTMRWPDGVRSSPSWCFAGLISAATRAALGDVAAARTQVDQQLQRLESAPAPARSLAWTRALASALTPGCAQAPASAGLEPIAKTMLETACQAARRR